MEGEYSHILSKYGFIFENGQYVKSEDGVEYYIYDGIVMGNVGDLIIRGKSMDILTYTTVLTYTTDLGGKYIIRDSPDKVYDYLLLEERKKNLNKLDE